MAESISQRDLSTSDSIKNSKMLRTCYDNVLNMFYALPSISLCHLLVNNSMLGATYLLQVLQQTFAFRFVKSVREIKACDHHVAKFLNERQFMCDAKRRECREKASSGVRKFC